MDEVSHSPGLTPGKCVSLGQGVRRIVAGNAGMMTGPGTNTYLLGLREVAVAIHTPGHASNCVCYLLESERLLFTGDHVLEGVSPVILPPDGDMSAYLHSLDKLQSHDFERIAPGHGGVMDGGKEILTALRAHRLAREDKVLRSLRRLAAATLDELTVVVYDDVATVRHRWARLTLEAHLIKLTREGRASERDGLWRPRA